MAAVLFIVCAVLACQAQALPQLLPLPSPCAPSIPSPCQPPLLPSPCQAPVVATTVIDNSVSNSLANALQLLIVSNLIENTMNGGCRPSPCDAIPVQATVFPGIDCLTPTVEYINPYIPYEPIPPCDIISPCEQIDIIPNIYYPEILPVTNIGCGCDVGPIGYPNIGCGCDNYGPNFGLPTIMKPNCGCGCDYSPNYGLPTIMKPNCGSGCDNFGPNIAMPNYGCGCTDCGPVTFPNVGSNIGYELLANAFGVKMPCDGPIFPPNIPAPINCNCGYLPNVPMGMNVDPWIIDPCACPNNCYGGGIYY